MDFLLGSLVFCVCDLLVVLIGLVVLIWCFKVWRFVVVVDLGFGLGL